VVAGGHHYAKPVTTRHAFDAGYTNIGAAAGGLLFHSLINSMWVLKQCMDAWAAQGRPWSIEDLSKRLLHAMPQLACSIWMRNR
jgi:hypothetical protein